MIRVGLAIALALLLASCATPVAPVQVPPPPANCNASCYVACDTAGIRYAGSPEDDGAFDRTVVDVVIPLKARLAECDTHRKACAQCIQRHIDAGVLQ